MARGEKTKLLWQNGDYKSHMSRVHLGGKNCLGKHWKQSPEAIYRRLGKPGNHLGHIHSEETKLRISENRKGKGCGEANGNWKGNQGVQEIKHRLRGTTEWKNWRKAIFLRDNYTCGECGKVGGYLEPNHIIPLRLEMDKKFNVNNGITLCRPCHQKTIWKEEQFIEKYSQLIANRV